MNLQLRKRNLLITEIAMTVILILFIALCLRDRVRDDISVDTLKPVLEAAVSDTSNMSEAGAMKLRSLYGLSANDYSEVLLYIPVTNMDAQEMLLVRCNSESQAEAVEAAMKERIEYERSIFESYGVEQMGIIEKAVVDVQGTYCLYVCDDNSAAVQDAFRAAVKE
ncbi:MAG: DUF4358 domain-containing protein [Lachnospiraceae bacterium]|nr:DUF4358 domain-containing protein [Lachnospiraceae bacterium]